MEVVADLKIFFPSKYLLLRNKHLPSNQFFVYLPPSNNKMTMINYNELVKNQSGDLIEKLVAHVIEKDPVEVLFNYLDKDQWAIISMHNYDEDLEISLRLHFNDFYDLYVGYYDDDDEFFEIIHPLTEEEKDILPNGLKKIMAKVLVDERGMRLAGKFLSR
ncbi:MAG: hypothetical protein WCN27_02730 [Alphaproteobacteria bacterium]